MPKIAVISFGMSDTIIPLLKNLSVREKDLEVSLFLVYGQNRKMEGIINFSSVPVKNGFVPEEQLPEILGPSVLDYIEGTFRVNVFVYQALKSLSLSSLSLTFRLFRRLRGFDLIHINGISGVIPQMALLLTGRKWLTTIHDLQQHSGEKTSSGERLTKLSLSRAKRVIMQNQIDLRKIGQYFPEYAPKARYVPFGYLDVYRSFLPKDPQSAPQCDILFFGRISKYKGLEYLLDALEILQEKGIQPGVIIAGGGDYDFGKARLADLDQVQVFNRFIENSELAALICNSRIVVCPYTDATQSGVLMTAFAFNKPVVATAVGGFKDVVKDGVNGLLVPPKDAALLAEALERLFADPELLENMRRNIEHRTGLEEYKWGNIARKLKEVYRELL